MRPVLAAIVLAGASFGTAGAASAVTVSPTCTTYLTSNGTTTRPGTFVGTVGNGPGQVCQIGDLTTNNGGTGAALVNTAHNPSIYEFYWGGGVLSISDKIGNNGIGDAINVELDSLPSQNSTTISSDIANITIPFSSGPSSTYFLISMMNLAAGYYDIDTSLAPNNVDDPNYQINFTAASPVPEPASLALLAVPALVAAARRRARA